MNISFTFKRLSVCLHSASRSLLSVVLLWAWESIRGRPTQANPGKDTGTQSLREELSSRMKRTCLNFTDGQEHRKNLAGLQRSEQGRHLPEPGCQGTQCELDTQRYQLVSPSFSHHTLALSLQSLETLYSRLISRGEDAPSITSSKEDVEKELLRILPCQAESVSCRAHVTINTSDVNVCSCDIWQLQKCYSDRLSVWSVRQLKSELEREGTDLSQCKQRSTVMLFAEPEVKAWFLPGRP